jgi:hypothetical protein
MALQVKMSINDNLERVDYKGKQNGKGKQAVHKNILTKRQKPRKVGASLKIRNK